MSVTGLILAGGRGTRMAEADKGLQLLCGVPMVQHVKARLAPQVNALMINANRNVATYANFGCPVWTDVTPNFAGPLAGLQAGLMHCDTPYLVSVPCDSPFLPDDLVQRLHHALQVDDADLAVAVTDATDAGGAAKTAGKRQRQSVFCLLKVALLPHLTDYLQNGGRTVHAWFAMLKTVDAYFADEAAFRNINTLDELRQCTDQDQ